ncbi:MAG: FAD/NAD(P)-binding protein [Deltaproteobacteria bacterium]|nr:FAD/NAD(P)-binding protein [Deltaproteobacteria bacterium]
MSNPYLPQLALIKTITEETGNIRTFTISFKAKTPFDPQPGQFIELSLFGLGEFPVSIAKVIDPAAGIFETTIRRVGGVTEGIADLRVNSTVGVRGPFGKGYPLEKLDGKDVILVAGGLGMASIKYLADCLLKNRDRYGRIILLYGAATPDDVLYKNSPSLFQSETKERPLEAFITVDKADNGWKGKVGMVTDLIDKIKPALDISRSMVAACGPSKMMKAVVDRFSKAGFQGEQLLLSLERRMQCGIGICGHCMMGEKRVCKDGPVISFYDVKDTLEELF